MSMFFLLPGVDSSLSLPKFYSSRKTQSIQTHRLNKLVTNSTTWTSFNISLLRYRAFLLSPHQYHFILFRVGADFVCIWNHIWNEKYSRSGFTCQSSFLSPQSWREHFPHQTFKEIKKEQEKRKLLKTLVHLEKFCSENYLTTFLCDRTKIANEICAYLIIRKWETEMIYIIL